MTNPDPDAGNTENPPDFSPASRHFVFCSQDILTPPSAQDHAWFDSGSPLLAPVAPFRDDECRSFEWKGDTYSACMVSGDRAARLVAAGALRTPVRQAIALYPENEVRAFLKGLALSIWMTGARFCGACGSPLKNASGEDSAGRICVSCGRVHFPRISPAVIVLIRRGETALFAHNTRFPPGRFGLLAGFVEVGETFEEALHREVREEAGIEIGHIVYRTSQPWPFPDSLMVAFTAEWVSGETRPDGEEIAELRWCAPDDLPDIPPPGSVARFLIDEFIAEAHDRSAGSRDAGRESQTPIGD